VCIGLGGSGGPHMHLQAGSQTSLKHPRVLFKVGGGGTTKDNKDNKLI